MFGEDIKGSGFRQGKLQQLSRCEDVLERRSAGSRSQLPERQALSRGSEPRESRKMLRSLEGVIGRYNVKLNLAEELLLSVGGTWTCPEREDAWKHHLPPKPPSFAPVPDDAGYTLTLRPGQLPGCDPALPAGIVPKLEARVPLGTRLPGSARLEEEALVRPWPT